MQPVTTGYASPGASTPADQAMPERAMSQAREHTAQEPDDGAASSSDEISVPLDGVYTSSARAVPVRAATPGSISIFA